MIKLLKTYQELEQQGSKGENISGTLYKIEEVMESVVGAFHKELDGLFAGTALDIEVEAKTLDMFQNAVFVRIVMIILIVFSIIFGARHSLSSLVAEAENVFYQGKDETAWVLRKILNAAGSAQVT